MTEAISVDIGVNELGWAVWDFTDTWGKPCAPLSVGVIKASHASLEQAARHKKFELKVMSLMEQFYAEVADSHNTQHIILEYPQQFGSARGQAAAAMGHTLQLAFAAGAHAEMAWVFGYTVELVTPSMWKGQLKKKLVEQRLRRAIGFKAQDGGQFRSHAWDAVGVGMFAKGFPMDDQIFVKEARR